VHGWCVRVLQHHFFKTATVFFHLETVLFFLTAKIETFSFNKCLLKTDLLKES